MDVIGIQSRAVFKVVAIVIVAIGVAVLLNHVIVEIKTTIRWLCAAIFLALALSPLVDLVSRAPRSAARSLPRWAAILVAYVLFFAALTFLVLAVIPPIVREVEHSARKLPTYVKDFSSGPRTTSTSTSSTTSTRSPACSPRRHARSRRSSATRRGRCRRSRSGILNNVVEAIVVLTLTYFLLLDGASMFRQITASGPDAGARANPAGRAQDRDDRPRLRLGEPVPRGARGRLHLARA